MTKEQYEKAKTMADTVVTPHIRKLVDKFNKAMSKDGIVAGLELQWFFDTREGQEARRNAQQSSDESED